MPDDISVGYNSFCQKWKVVGSHSERWVLVLVGAGALSALHNICRTMGVSFKSALKRLMQNLPCNLPSHIAPPEHPSSLPPIFAYHNDPITTHAFTLQVNASLNSLYFGCCRIKMMRRSLRPCWRRSAALVSRRRSSSACWVSRTVWTQWWATPILEACLGARGSVSPLLRCWLAQRCDTWCCHSCFALMCLCSHSNSKHVA